MTRTAETRPRQHHRPQGWLGPLLLRLHFFAGILVGPFILVAATSGALYVISPQIEEVVYADTLHVEPSTSTLTLGEQVEIAQEHVAGEAPLSAVRPAPEPGDTTRIMFAQEGLGESASRAIFIDPGTGEIRGDLTVYGTSGSLPLRTWVSDLHRSLHLGDVGRHYSELAASWLWIVASAGLVLWVLRVGKTRSRPPGAGRHRDPARAKPAGRRRLLRWHTGVGAGVLLAALFLSATGITWSQHAGANVTGLRATLGWATPTVSTSLDAALPAGDEHAHHHGAMADPSGEGEMAVPEHIDHVLEVARGVSIDSSEIEILPPAEDGTAWVVQEIHRSYPTEVDVVAVDGATLEVVDRVDFADYPLMAKLARWGVDLHMGTMFGLANQIVLFLVAVGIASMVVLGYAMWWRRRPARAPHPLGGRAPRRGALRGAPWWGLAAVGAVAAAIGVLLPLVGWTLLGFLAVDVALGLRRDRGPARSTR